MPKKKKENYLNNEEFLEAIKDYQIMKKEGRRNRRLENFVGECFYKLAQNYSTKGSFRNYPFREEMVSDAVFYCIKYIDRFNPEITTNPFGYFSLAIRRSFLQRIMKEKKYLYTKYKVIENTEIFNMMADTQDVDNHSDYIDSVGYSESSRKNMEEFVKDYEEKLEEKKQKQNNGS